MNRKRTILVTAVIALLAAAVFAGQAVAAKPTGSSVVIETLEGSFDSADYPTGYMGYYVEETYPEVRHVTLTISAENFDTVWDESAQIRVSIGDSEICLVDDDRWWEDSHEQFKTFEFVADYWNIALIIGDPSDAEYHYAAIVTYPR